MRLLRVVVLGLPWLTLSAAGQGQPHLATAPRPVQLAFGLAPRLAEPPRLVAAALRAGNPVEFYTASLISEYVPPAGDDYQQRLIAEGAERAAAEVEYGRLFNFDGDAKSRGAAAAPTQTRAQLFRSLASRARLSASIFRDVAAKRRIFRRSDYSHLTGPNGRRIPLAEASDARVGRAYKKLLSSGR